MEDAAHPSPDGTRLALQSGRSGTNQIWLNSTDGDHPVQLTNIGWHSGTPRWYGVANVKWLTRIEVIDHRNAGRFMARDYVSIREEQRDNQTVWTFTTVSHDRLKSAPAKVTRLLNRYAIMGAAWGAPISAVEVQVDDGPWTAARLERPPSNAAVDVQTDDRPSSARLEIPTSHRRRSRDYVWWFWRFVGGRPLRASTRFGRGRSTSTATSSQRRTTHSSPARGPTGRATGK